MISPERWFEVHFVVCVVLWLSLVVAVPIYSGNENLPVNALILGAFLIAVTFLCAAGIGYAHTKRDKFGTFAVFFAIVALHIVTTVLMIAEWTENDCTGHMFAICANGTTNFLAVILIDLVVQMFFLLEYKMLWAWKNALIDEKRRVPVFETDDEDDTIQDKLAVRVDGDGVKNKDVAKF